MRSTPVGIVLALIVAAPASAQDGMMTPMDFSAQTQAYTNSVIGGLSVEDTARAERRRSPNRRAPPPRRGPAPAARAAASDARLPFVSTAVSQKRALDDYLAGVVRTGQAKEAATISAELRARNPSAELRPEMRKNGLDPDDLADVMAAFLVTGWEATGNRDATKPEIRAIRRQVAGSLTANAAFRAPERRVRFAEDLKVMTYVVAVSAAAAKRDGRSEQFERGIRNFYLRQTGIDLSKMRATPAGLMP